jgi:hypothetical protein
VTAIEVTKFAVLDGFTITGGRADGTASRDRRRGGGIYIEDGWPRIMNCTIQGNFAGTGDPASGGGGVGIKLVSLDPDPEAGETARFDDCSIVSNDAYEVGGGVFVGQDSPG